MATEKQLAANRANAKKSTGPRTPEGKARSARNALTHGLASDALAVLRVESPDQVDALKADAVEVYQPVNDEEMFAVERIALTKLAIIRAARLEAGLFTSMLDHSLNADNITPYTPLDPRLTQDVDLHIDQNRNFALATGFQRLLHSNHAFTLFLRYQAHAERQYRRAVEAFDNLRQRRPAASPNEPVSPPQIPQSPSETPSPNEPDFCRDADAPHRRPPARSAASPHSRVSRPSDAETPVRSLNSESAVPYTVVSFVPDRPDCVSGSRADL